MGGQSAAEVTAAVSKKCNGCGESKPLSEFGSRTRIRSDGSELRSHRSRCKACGLSASRAYQAEHLDEARARAREYQRERRAADPEAARERSRQYVAAKKSDPDWRRQVNERIKKSHAKMRARDPLLFRRQQLRLYGLTLADYDRMLLQQGKRCAICATDAAGTASGVFVVDHDHATGAVRGLLCAACNRMLGDAKDRQSVLRRAADYLDAQRER